MFDLWNKIEEKGAVAIPIRSEALTRLEWAEVEELYPELVPEAYRGYNVYSDDRLICESPGNAVPAAGLHPEDDARV